MKMLLPILLLSICTNALASEEAKGSGQLLSHLAPVNIAPVAPPPAPVRYKDPVTDSMKFELYDYQKQAIAEEEQRQQLASMPQQPLVIVVNQPAPQPAPENPLVSVLKFGIGVASRGILRF